ncbi:DUF1214 domain-containing protein [Cupriavidus alkaliphilus]|uniref:DUF1214 domain-containing protein n=1 Tax=Cupriavidus alkaliphilus TaxID=942866 RepID=UPI0021AD3B19|nr:DUF1214 domain-containing protein [Cupriavidus alkaliphilus]
MGRTSRSCRDSGSPHRWSSATERPGLAPAPCAFWSVSVYNAAGYFQKNPANAYTVNNLTAKKGGDGAIAIQFGGCDGQVPNWLPVVEGWNYTVRRYRTRAEVLSGAWNFPQPQPVN